MRITRTASQVIAIALGVSALAACGADAEPEDSSPTASATASAAPPAALDDRPVDEQAFEAVRESNLELARLALEAGADPNFVTQDNTLVSIAITRNDAAMVELLLAEGGSIELPDGNDMLWLAGANGDAQMVALLLANGATVDGDPGYEGSPIGTAAYEGNDAVVTALLEAGADVNIEIPDGQGGFFTPIFAAAYGGNAGTAELLLTWGADPTYQDSGGYTAGEWADSQGYDDVAELLTAVS